MTCLSGFESRPCGLEPAFGCFLVALEEFSDISCITNLQQTLLFLLQNERGQFVHVCGIPVKLPIGARLHALAMEKRSLALIVLLAAGDSGCFC